MVETRPLGNHVVALVGLAFVACGPAEETPTTSYEQQAVTSLSPGEDPFFNFLPPLAGPAATGSFDASLSPVVEICELAGDDCVAVVEQFTTQTSPPILVRPVLEWYAVWWNARQTGLDTQKLYRISVLVEGTELGHIDVSPVECTYRWRTRLCGVTNVDTGDFIALRFGLFLPIRFRINTGAVFVVGPNGASFDADGQNVQVVVPPGSVTSTTGITVRAYTVTATTVGAIAGTAYDLGPDGSTFDPPLSLSIAYDPAALPAGVSEQSLVMLTSNDGTTWTEIPSTVDTAADQVTALVAHFTFFTIAEGGNAVSGTVRLDGAPTFGVVVYADENDDGVRQGSEPTGATLADGTYRIEGVTFTPVGPLGSETYFGPNIRIVNPDPATYEIANPIPGFAVLAGLPSNLATGIDFDLATLPPSGATVEGVVTDRGAAAVGVTVYADIDGDGMPDAGEPSDVTSATGSYSVPGIAAGAGGVFIIRIVNPDPATLEITSPSGGAHVLSLVDGDVATGRDFVLDLLPATGTAVVRGRIQVRDPALASVGTYGGTTVYVDLDDDGVFDPGEPSAVSAFAHPSSSNGGDFRIEGVPAGTFRVRAVNPDPTLFGSIYTQLNVPVTFRDGMVLTTDFFLDLADAPAAVSGAALLDTVPLEGAIVFADTDGNGVINGNERFTFTAFNSPFSLYPPGAYVLRVFPAGAVDIRIIPPASTAIISPASGFYPMTLASGSSAGLIDFVLMTSP